MKFILTKYVHHFLHTCVNRSENIDDGYNDLVECISYKRGYSVFVCNYLLKQERPFCGSYVYNNYICMF